MFEDVRTLSAAEAQAGTRAGELVLVDVRESREIDSLPVAGALHLPLSELSRRLGELPPDVPIAFFCRSGRRAAVAAQLARTAGLEAHNVRGGLEAWRGAGLPLDVC